MRVQGSAPGRALSPATSPVIAGKGGDGRLALGEAAG
jgi:hypothetical protein